MEQLADRTADELDELNGRGIFDSSRQMIRVRAAQAAGNRVAGELPVRILLIPAPDALGLARAAALFEKGLVLGPLLIGHGASYFLDLLNRHEAIHEPAIKALVQKNAVHLALVKKFLPARLPVHVISPGVFGTHGAQVVALNGFNLVVLRVERAEMGSIEVEKVMGFTININQCAVLDATDNALASVTLFTLAGRAVFFPQPFGIECCVCLDALTHTHMASPLSWRGEKCVASQLGQRPFPSPSPHQAHPV